MLSGQISTAEAFILAALATCKQEEKQGNGKDLFSYCYQQQKALQIIHFRATEGKRKGIVNNIKSFFFLNHRPSQQS